MDELCIRFVNTVGWRLKEPRQERLASAEAVLHWLGENNLVGGEQVAHLIASWQRNTDAAGFYAESIALREAIYGIFAARAGGRPPEPEHIDLLNEWLARPAPGVKLTLTGDGLCWRPSTSIGLPADLLRPIALSAADLIMGPRAARVRQCADSGGCGWLFVDESRAQNRRWCSMGDCGNRAKAARHRARKRQA